MFVFVPDPDAVPSELVWVARQGGETRIGVPPHNYSCPRLSPDGTKIAVAAADGEKDFWVWDIPKKTPFKLTSGPARKISLIWTLDGRWIAYQSKEGSDQEEIQVRPFPNTDARQTKISSGGGFRPVWTPSDPSDWARSDNRELIYVSQRARRGVAVKVLPAPPGALFAYGTPTTLFDATKCSFGAGGGYDVSRDGQQFLMAKRLNADEKRGQSLTVVTHWFDVVRAAMKGT